MDIVIWSFRNEVNMCYSVMVEQDAKRLARQFDAKLQFDMFAELFERRTIGEKLVLNKAMEAPFLKDAKTMAEKVIAKMIRQWHSAELLSLKTEIAKQTERLISAKESLKKKETKKAIEEIRIATNKISKMKFDQERHLTEEIESESDERVFPKNYVSILTTNKSGEKIVMPIRYHMRPHEADENFDLTHNGCYNARFDKLTLVPFWRDSLENGRRGIMVVKKFYENVATVDYLKNKKLPTELTEKNNIVVRFEPKGVDVMYIPVLWDSWGKKKPILFSGALITDDPPPEVQAAGHDRCPIFLKENAINDWLNTKIKSGKEIKEKILSQRETPFYNHKVLGDFAVA